MVKCRQVLPQKISCLPSSVKLVPQASEFGGDAIRAFSIEGRMTVCTLAIEAGARAGMVAVDETTIKYVRGRTYSPTGETLKKAEAYWSTLHSDENAHFD